jgi:hypothetical protein
VKFIVLIIAGLSVGVLRQSKKEAFLIASLGVIITGLLFTQLLGAHLSSFVGVLQMIINFVIFLSAAVLVVGLHFVANILTGEKEPEELIKDKKIKNFKFLPAHETFEKIWSYVILIAVALTFIVLLSETFFDVTAFLTVILILDVVITALFITDLVVLYRHASGFGDFVRRHIFDIIAAIPTVGILRLLKIVRVVRLIRVFKVTTEFSKVIKVGKVHKTTKYLSDESYFNKLNKKTKKKTAKKTTSVSKKKNKK